MFGSKRNKIQEQIKEAFAQINEQREAFEEKVSSIEESGERMQTDICQIVDNTHNVADYATKNIEEQSTLIHNMDDFSKELKATIGEYNQLAESIKNHHEAVTNLVEENKHYTTPAKYLTEAPSKILQAYRAYEVKVDDMAEKGRQMSVMALNAAIEAGRIGEDGKQFVAVSEEIRQTALDYEAAALSMKEEFQEAQSRIHELEEYVFRLVSLIKDGNVATTRLLKKSTELNKCVRNSSMRDFSEDIILMRDKVIAMRNLDEEIEKASERNKIRLSDIQEEIQTQKKELRDLESDLSYILDEAQKKA